MKLNASVQKKNIIDSTYVRWFPKEKKGVLLFGRDDVEPIYSDGEADDKASLDSISYEINLKSSLLCKR